ncbi:GntR family transcriptional regulator [Mycolicibacterium sp. OfavD-34-C]|uniref:GntR family transcriptional regulator n=1 Tax=Mycolicibacterium sp. OfavD-34-C TaxID=2917746 RepID=UPI001EF4FFA7|nr:GntR family transcriptional regulator [Mycolicibacterium sp. OfavD-34-C]MCG7580409.1 GntR family transcriptional regulator [Mycolicibacterium sp. OfavD-34-C]
MSTSSLPPTSLPSSPSRALPKAAPGVPGLGPSPIRTAYTTVTDRLRKAIIAGELPGGTRLVQAELAQSLSVSVTPVREALRNLMSEGLVDYSPFHGATVHQTSRAELEDIYELRSVLIPLAVREGVKNITRAELDAAEQLAHQMAAETDPIGWVELNREFHKVFYVASRRPKVYELLVTLADLSSLYVGLSISGDAERRARGDDDHLEIVQAYRATDLDAATRITLAHNLDTLEVARAMLDETGGGSTSVASGD